MNDKSFATGSYIDFIYYVCVYSTIQSMDFYRLCNRHLYFTYKTVCFFFMYVVNEVVIQEMKNKKMYTTRRNQCRFVCDVRKIYYRKDATHIYMMGLCYIKVVH